MDFLLLNTCHIIYSYVTTDECQVYGLKGYYWYKKVNSCVSTEMAYLGTIL